MVLYYIIKKQLKFLSYFIFYSFYKLYLYLYIYVFKGYNFIFSGFGAFNEDTDEMVERHEITPDLDSLSPTRISTTSLINFFNRGLWYFFECGVWLGNRIKLRNVKFNIFYNDVFGLKVGVYGRKAYKYRLLTYHVMFYRKLLFLRLIVVMSVLEFFVLYLNGLWFFIFVFIFLNLYLYKKFIIIFRVNLLKLFFKPVIFEETGGIYLGSLNTSWLLASKNYFFKIKDFFFRKHQKLWKNGFDVLASKMPSVKNLNFHSKMIRNKKILIDTNFFISNMNLLKTFWNISDEKIEAFNLFVRNFTKKKISYGKRVVNIFFIQIYKIVVKFYFYKFNSLFDFLVKHYFLYLQKIILNITVFEYLKYLFIHCYYGVFFIFIAVLFYVMNCSLQLLILISSICVIYLMFEFILLRDAFATVFSRTLFGNFLLKKNEYVDYILFSMDNVLEKDFSTVASFSWDEYVKLLKIEFNIGLLEQSFNEILLDQETLFRLNDLKYDEEDVKLFLKKLYFKYYSVIQSQNMFESEVVTFSLKGTLLNNLHQSDKLKQFVSEINLKMNNSNDGVALKNIIHLYDNKTLFMVENNNSIQNFSEKFKIGNYKYAIKLFK